MALLAIPLTPIQIILPIFLAPYTTGSEPPNLWLKSNLPRLLLGGVITFYVYITPQLLSGEEPDLEYFSILAIIYMTHQLFIYAMFMDQDSFQTGSNWFYGSVTDLEKSLVLRTGPSVPRDPDSASMIMKIQKAKN